MAARPSQLERALIQAIAGLPPLSSAGFVKLVDVVAATASTLDRLTATLDDCLWDESLDWADDEYAFFEQCAFAIRDGEHFEAQGNYGGVDEIDGEFPPAHPKFLECRLTQRGRDALREFGEKANGD